MSTTIIKRLSIGRPGGEDLQFSGIILKVSHLSLVDIIGNKVALRIENLNLVMIDSMKVLSSLIGRIDYQIQPRVPGWIDSGRKNRIIFHVYLSDLAVIGNNGASIVLTGMELHAPRIILLVMMAVDALAVFLKST